MARFRPVTSAAEAVLGQGSAAQQAAAGALCMRQVNRDYLAIRTDRPHMRLRLDCILCADCAADCPGSDAASTSFSFCPGL
jgi:hypothetical protein